MLAIKTNLWIVVHSRIRSSQLATTYFLHGEQLKLVINSTDKNLILNLYSQNDSYAALLARRDDMRKLMRVSRDEIDGDEEASMSPEVAEANAKNFHTLGSLDEEEADSDESGYVEASPKSSGAHQKDEQTTRDNEQQQQQQLPQQNEPADFIKCPISETIKKLANASLRSSKPMRMMPNAGTCLDDGESPSLMQRKRLLAQHGVTV